MSRSGRSGDKVGFVTSGGYGHTVGKSLAMALVDADLAAEGTELSVHVVGVERAGDGDRGLALRSRGQGDAAVGNLDLTAGSIVRDAGFFGQ